MAEKMLDSTREGMTKSSSRLASIYGNDSLELVWENGQVLVQGVSSSTTRNTPSCTRHSLNPSRDKEANDEDACIAKSARLNTFYSLVDFPVQRDSNLDSSRGNSHQSNDHDSSQLDLQFLKSKSSSNLKDGYANLRPVKESKLTGGAHQPATTANGYLCTSSTRQCTRMDSSQKPATNYQKHDLGKANFSNVIRPSLLEEEGNSATLPTDNTVLTQEEEIKARKVAKVAAAATSSSAPGHSLLIDSFKGSYALRGLQRQTPFISDLSNPVSFAARSQEPLPDEHSEALSIPGSHGQYYNQTSSLARLRAKGKDDTNFGNEPLLECSSVCSLGASNNTNLCSGKHEDTDDSTYLSDNDEEAEDVVKEKPARKGTRVKRRRNAEIHNLYERARKHKRRDKINKKMRMLKELIPNCNKMDKASLLDDAIEYLKTLKLQLQIMSRGTRLCMPFMMLPPRHMINTPHLLQFMGAGMGFRPGTGIHYSVPQFPIPPLPAAITDNRVRMFGFPNQVPPMPTSHAPFIPMVGNPSTQSLVATSTAANLAENLASAQLATQSVSVTKNSYLNGEVKDATKQAQIREQIKKLPNTRFGGSEQIGAWAGRYDPN